MLNLRAVQVKQFNKQNKIKDLFDIQRIQTKIMEVVINILKYTQ